MATRQEADERVAAADAAHAAAEERLVRGYDERIASLHAELAADSTRRGSIDAQLSAERAKHAAALEAAQAETRQAVARLDLAAAEAAQLERAAAAAREQAAAARAAGERTHQVRGTQDIATVGWLPASCLCFRPFLCPAGTPPESFFPRLHPTRRPHERR